MHLQAVLEPLPEFLLKLLMTTFIYFKISVFQKHHALHRVFPDLASTPHRLPSDGTGKFCAPLESNAAA